jgi:hypothetical protein
MVTCCEIVRQPISFTPRFSEVLAIQQIFFNRFNGFREKKPLKRLDDFRLAICHLAEARCE